MTAYDFIAEGLLKSGGILALGLAVNWIFRRAAPKYRYRLWMPLFVILLVLPFLLMLPRWEIIPSFSPGKPETIASPTMFHFAAPEASFEIIGETKPAQTPAPKPDWNWQSFVVLFWATGVFLLLLRLLFVFFRLSHWRLTVGKESIPAPIAERLNDLQTELGIDKRVALILSEKVGSPFTWGWLRPFIALPTDAAHWSETEVEMVLRHELTHLERRDSLNVVITGIVTALNWPNPLAWLASKQVTQLQELICDTEVLTAGCSADQYAELLFSHAQSGAFPFSATAMARPGNLENRINMILNPTTQLSGIATARAGKLHYLSLTGLLAVSLGIVFLGMARTALAQPSGNQRLIIHTYHDSKTGDVSRLGFEMNGKEFEFDQLEESLRPIAKQNTVLALTPRAPLPMEQLKRVIDVAEAAGIRYLIFEKPEVIDSRGHDDHEIQNHSNRMQTVRKPSRPKHPGAPGEFIAQRQATQPESLLMKKLNAIRIPNIDFTDTALGDALRFLQQKTEELDTQTPDPNLKGINIVVKGNTDFQQTPVTLSLSNISLAAALQFTAELANADIRVDENAVFLQARKGPRRNNPALGEDPEARAATEKKLNTLVLPSVEFDETSLRDALAFLRSKSVEFDTGTTDPNQKGINLVLTANGREGKNSTSVTLRLKNIKLGDAIRYTADLADHSFQVRGNTVVVHPKLPPAGGGFGQIGMEGGGGGFGFGGGTANKASAPFAGGSAPKAKKAVDPFGGR